MFSKAVPAWKARRLANKMGFSRTDHIQYLGISLKLTAYKKADFSSLLQKIYARIREWGVRALSIAGRLVLINTVLLMMPVFSISHCIVPSSILQEIGKVARNFLWKGRDGRGMHYISWDKICRPKHLGGLGVHDLELWQPALMARHAFKLMNGGSPLLHSCITHKYGSCMDTNIFHRSDSSAWKILCKGFSVLKDNIIWKVKDGSQINFMHDKWIMGKNLMQWPTTLNMTAAFPDRVSELLTPLGEWDLPKLMSLFDESMIHNIMSTRLDSDLRSDCAQIFPRLSGSTISGSVYSNNFSSQQRWHMAWVHKLQLRPRELLFWWRLCCDAIPTLVWLNRRGLVADTKCPWGCPQDEDRAHLLLNCEVLHRSLDALQKWGIKFEVPSTLRSLFKLLSRESRKK